MPNFGVCQLRNPWVDFQKILQGWLRRGPHPKCKYWGQSVQRGRVCACVKLSPPGVYFFSFYPAPGRYRERGIVFARFLSFFLSLFVSLFVSLFLSQQDYEKTDGPICMKFSGKVSRPPGIPGNPPPQKFPSGIPGNYWVLGESFWEFIKFPIFTAWCT